MSQVGFYLLIRINIVIVRKDLIVWIFYIVLDIVNIITLAEYALDLGSKNIGIMTIGNREWWASFHI